MGNPVTHLFIYISILKLDFEVFRHLSACFYLTLFSVPGALYKITLFSWQGDLGCYLHFVPLRCWF